MIFRAQWTETTTYYVEIEAETAEGANILFEDHLYDADAIVADGDAEIGPTLILDEYEIAHSFV